MKLLRHDGDQVELRLGLDELILLRSMLGEVCHRFELSEQDFQRIFDAPRHDAEALSRRMGLILERLGIVSED